MLYYHFDDMPDFLDPIETAQLLGQPRPVTQGD